MANLPALGMKSLGEFMGIEGVDASLIQEAYDSIQNRKMKQTTSVQKVLLESDNRQDEPTRVIDLNIKDMSDAAAGRHIIDVVHDFEGELPVPDIISKLKANDYKGLPPPLCEKSEAYFTYIMNVNICKQDNGKLSVVKWYIFDQKQRIADLQDILIYGLAYQPSWVAPAHNITVKKVLLCLFQRLPGTTVLYMNWVGDENRKEETVYDAEKRHEGWKFIRDCGPKANNLNQFVEWTDEWVNLPGSKIFGWNKGEVKESLSNYAKGKAGAKTIDQWPATLRKLYPQILDLLVIPMLKTHDVHATLWIGKTRVGKSIAPKTFGFATAGFQIQKHQRSDLVPSVITCKRIDFLRLEPGSVFKPAIGDDILMHKMEPDEVKCMGDPGEEDALLWARWGGASFEMNQNSQIRVNPYDKIFEKSVHFTTNGTEETITCADFIRIIEVNFPQGSTDSDVEAYLSRYHIYLLTDTHIYYRYASPSRADVPRMKWPNPRKPDLLVPEAIETLKRYKKDSKYKPEGYAADFLWDVALMNALANDQVVPRSMTFVGPTALSAGQSVATYVYPKLPPPVVQSLAASSSMLPPPVVQPLAASSSSNMSPSFCGTAADHRELQGILRSQILESGMDGSTIDLRSEAPTSSNGSFCGDEDDAQELQAIFSSRVSAIAGQEFEIISSDEDMIQSPPRSPPRKKHAAGEPEDVFDQQEMEQAKMASLQDAVGGSVALPSFNFDETVAGDDVEGNPFAFGLSLDSPF